MNEIITNFLDVVKNKYKLFDGRARRREFWYIFLGNFILVVVLGIIDSLIGMPILGTIYSLAVLLPPLGVSISSYARCR